MCVCHPPLTPSPRSIASNLARVTEAAHYASIVSPLSAEQVVPLADELLTHATSLIATAGAWIHTGGDGNHVQYVA